MSDILDENGLQTKTLNELIDELSAELRTIYGDDINLEQNSPDGQVVGIFAQAGIDLREVINKVNAGFDPDQAAGRILDQRVGINGIKRNPGTFTYQDIDVVTDRALTLQGLDSQATDLNVTGVYTIRDEEGNEFYLLDSQSPASAGTYTYTFRAAELGQIEVLPNTITTPVTVIAGIVSVNNPGAPNSVGSNEEKDFDLKIRRRTSVALPALGYLDSIEAEINDLDNVSEAKVLENDTGSIDSYGTNPHTIWAIVEGGSPSEIGEVLFKKKTSGAGMRGNEVVDITRIDGGNFQARFDRPVSQDLYIRFTLIFSGSVDVSNLKQQIVDGVLWGISDNARADTITVFVNSINSNYIITEMQVSDNGSTWVEVVSVASAINRFVNDVSRITITIP